MHAQYQHTLYHTPCSSLDLHKEFPEEAHSIALHPSGLFVLVGFTEKLRLMSLLIDDIRPYKEFLIRSCREVSRSTNSWIPSESMCNNSSLFPPHNTHTVLLQSWRTFVCCSKYKPYPTILNLLIREYGQPQRPQWKGLQTLYIT